MQAERRLNLIRNSVLKSKSGVAIALLLSCTFHSWSQDSPQARAGLPGAPQPSQQGPAFLRPNPVDYGRPRGYLPSPFAPYEPISVPPPHSGNSVQFESLVKNGKIYLSLGDAVMLALNDNYDIAIQRINLDIADTDLLRTRTGQLPQGTSTSLVTNTLGGTGSAVTSGGGPGGSSVAGTGAGGIAVSTSGAGPAPENMDPSVTGTIQLQREKQPQTNILFSGGLPSLNTNTDEYNFTYSQGFISGTSLQITFNNTRETTNSPFQVYSPSLQTNFNAQVTQHLLQGFGPGMNGRFIIQAKNNRRIADSVFRQQLLYTINQIEQLYWGLVSAYDDVQSKQRALQQSTQLVTDEEKQLQVGTVAPLDVVNARSGKATDEQALISSESNLEYQQLLMKQAIARNLDDPALASAPVIPTDRIDLAETPEEDTPVNDLVREAEANSPAVEQSILTLQNDKITLRGARNALLPTVDVYAFYGAEGLGGAQSPSCQDFFTGGACKPGMYAPVGYGSTFTDLFNSSGPDKGAGFNINIPLRNRAAQALQARSQLEFRQAQMRLQQLYVQIRMQVINAQYALTNDRATVNAAVANRDYAGQSLDAEKKRLSMGASTAANVLQQERNLAASEASVISAINRYAVDRASLEQILGATLQNYRISIVNAATGNIQTPPAIPGLKQEAVPHGQEQQPIPKS